MAINAQKFLPSSKGGALVKVNKSIIKSSSVQLSEKSLSDFNIMRIKVIEIDDILKGTLALQKKELDNKKKEDSSKRREKIEEKLETKPKVESGKIKMPNLPRMGFLDWVKNFIGNVILGYFAVRLVDHLPKIIPIIKFLGKATDFVLNLGGKLLDGLVTFIDWGYKAYDATRGFVKNLFGEGGVKQFDQLSGLLNQFLNLAIIAGMATAGSGRFGGKGGRTAKPKPTTGGRPRITTSGGSRAGTVDLRNPLRQRPQITGTKPQLLLPGSSGGNRVLLSSVRPFLKRIPIPVIGALIDFGLSVALGENPGRAAFRAIGAGILATIGGGLAGVLGLAGGPLAVATAALGSIAGGALGDMAGGALYDLFFGGKKPSGKPKKYAGGGVTRGGRPQRGIRRSIPKKGRYKRKLIPQKPGDVEAKSPGSDVGGEDKILGLFPNPLKSLQKATDVMNPFKVIQSAGNNLGESDYFGPILAITSKILLGQKPTQQDYKNIGLGINLLVNKGIDDKKLRGGLAAFAEGGFVDPKTLDAISQGGDISDWVAKTFKESTETNAQKTLREIQENLKLKKDEDGEKDLGGVPGAEPEGSGPGGIYSGSAVGAGVLKNDPAFVDAVNKLSVRLGVNPAHMLGFMEIETAGTFSPSIDNGLGYVGLIQFGPSARADLGVSKKQLQSMSRIQQLEWVEKYFKNVNKMIGKNVFAPGGGATAADLYTAVFLPAYVGKPDSFTFPSMYWAANPALRDNSKPGAPIWKGYIGKLVTQRAQKYGAANISMNVRSSDLSLGSRPGYSGSPDLSNVPRGDTSRAASRLLRDFPRIRTRSNSRQIYASGLGFWMKKNFPTPGEPSRRGTGDYGDPAGGRDQMEHPDHGGVVASHRGRGHYEGRALDLGGNGGGRYKDQDYMWPYITRFLKTYGLDSPSTLPQVLHAPGENYQPRHGGGPDAGHADHLHVEFSEGGITPGKSTYAIVGERGREFIIDADSTKAIEGTFPGFLGAINKAKYTDAINVLRNFASYESGAEQTFVILENEMQDQSQDYNSSSGFGFFMSGGHESDPSDILYQGG